MVTDTEKKVIKRKEPNTEEIRYGFFIGQHGTGKSRALVALKETAEK